MSTVPVAGAPTAPPTRLPASLVATVLAFFPLGVVAVVYSLRTSDAIAAGDLDRARRQSTLNRRWLIATVIVGVVLWAFLVLVLLLLGAFAR